jgi:glucan-binding YG repeat protein
MLKTILNKIFPKTSYNKTEAIFPPVQIQKIYLFESNQKELEDIINSPMLTDNASGYIYFVQEYMNGSFKIGKTKYIEKRMNLFGVKLPFENKLIYLIKTSNHHQTEAAFHKHFSSKRLEGEWFALTKEDIAWIKAGKYTPAINQTINPQIDSKKKTIDVNLQNEDKPLTNKQIEFAKSLILKLENEYELLIDHTSLTQTDLKRLSVYFRFKNTGALNNLVKSGVLKAR